MGDVVTALLLAFLAAIPCGSTVVMLHHDTNVMDRDLRSIAYEDVSTGEHRTVDLESVRVFEDAMRPTPVKHRHTGDAVALPEFDYVPTEELDRIVVGLTNWDPPDPLPAEVQGFRPIASRSRHQSDEVATTPLTYGGRHHRTDTGEFARIVATSWTAVEQETLHKAWWCETCDPQTPEAHMACQGCACPCTLQAVAA